jgi:acetylornithine deacetylase/succinyl-diaminopimelate desuccinylase-like protein
MNDASLERVEHDALRLLQVLCRRPSVSAEGRALEETADLVEELLAESGFETRQLPAGDGPPGVYGEQRGRSDYTLLLYNHYDVQPVDPLELWESPPFEPTIRDGRLFARGTADNKGELAVRLAVVRSLRKRSGELPITIRWIVEGEEENASPHFDEIVRANADILRADACLWEGAPARLSDGRPSLALGFKGCLAVRLDVRLLKRDAHSANAAFTPSAPGGSSKCYRVSASGPATFESSGSTIAFAPRRRRSCERSPSRASRSSTTCVRRSVDSSVGASHSFAAARPCPILAPGHNAA